jgi:hypothetical protein
MHLEAQIVGALELMCYIEAQSLSGLFGSDFCYRKKMSDPSVFQGLLPLMYIHPNSQTHNLLVMTRCN